MGWVVKFTKSSIGAKIIMALSGVVIFGFVIGHMLGNLQVYLGQDAYNRYAHFLKTTPELLWGVRVGLLIAVLLHIGSGLRLAALNAAARPVRYQRKVFIKATLTSRTMALSGLLLLTFIVYHLAHFTLGLTEPEHFHLLDPQGRHDVYSMFILAFKNTYVSAAYIVAMLCLGMHLKHGVSSLFQTLGIYHPRYNALIQSLGPVFAAIIVLGNISMPVAVMLDCIKLPMGVP